MIPSAADLQMIGGGNGVPARGTYFPSRTHIETDPTPSVPPHQQRIPHANALGSNGTSPGSPMSRCTNCHLFHLRDKPCPNLRTEIHIRLALDDVKALSGGDLEKTRQNKEILQNILRAKKVGRPALNAGPPVQSARQPERAQQPPQQQARLAAPQQQFEKESSGPDDDESGSEESSDYESDEGSGKGSV